MILNWLTTERRYFVHKRLGRAALGFLEGGVVGAARGFVASRPRRLPTRRSFSIAPPAPRRPPPRSTTARPSALSAVEKEVGRRAKFGAGFMRPGGGSIIDQLHRFAPSAGKKCPPLMKPNPVTGNCELFLGDRPGPDTRELPTGPGVAIGEAIMGRYGAAYMPGSKIVDRAVCLPGDVVGDDGLCYPRSSLRNSQRAWPKGRRPLLTGGDMRAISTASRAATRMTRTAVRLQEMGLIKKPIARKPPKKK